MARDTTPYSNKRPRNPKQVLQTQLQQEQIQAACLLAIELTDKARQPLTADQHSVLKVRLSELIQHQQDMENELGRLQCTPPAPSPQSLAPLWWQVAELETLIYGLHQALHPAKD